MNAPSWLLSLLLIAAGFLAQGCQLGAASGTEADPASTEAALLLRAGVDDAGLGTASTLRSNTDSAATPTTTSTSTNFLAPFDFPPGCPSYCSCGCCRYGCCACNGTRLTGGVESDEVEPVCDLELPDSQRGSAR